MAELEAVLSQKLHHVVPGRVVRQFGLVALRREFKHEYSFQKNDDGRKCLVCVLVLVFGLTKMLVSSVIKVILKISK